MFKFFLFQLGQFLVDIFPPSFSYLIALLISDLHYYLHFIDRRNVIVNLTCILHNRAKAHSIAREVFRNFGRYLMEFFLMRKYTQKDFIERNVSIKNLASVEKALAQGKGGILLTAHIGNWELGGGVLGALGYPLTVIALPHKERPVNDLFNDRRQTQGLTVVPTNNAVIRCIAALKRNELIALVADRDFSLQGEVLEFFGRHTFLPKGPAVFSLKTGAPIIPVFLLRDGREKFTLDIKDPLFPEIVPGLSKEENVIHLMEKYIRIIEDIIRQFPAQWLMFRKFEIA